MQGLFYKSSPLSSDALLIHTQGRTAHYKYQAEIVHGNPVWMAPETAAQLGLQDGDWVEVSIKRPDGPVWGAAPDTVCGSCKQYIRAVPGVAPGTLACSHHLGHWEFGQVGSGKLRAPSPAIAGMSCWVRRSQ